MKPITYLRLRNKLKKIYFLLRKPKRLKFPHTISIELCTLCNARCKFCPQRQIKRKKVMSGSTFRKIIDESVGHPELKLIKPFMYGEPFVTPYFFERLRYIRKKLPNVKIRIVTNGLALTNDKAEKLIKDCLCDEVYFSIDAVDSKTFKEFKGISYETVVDNILSFLKKNREEGGRIKTIANFVHTKENKGQLKKFKRFWRGKVDGFHIGTEIGLSRRTDFLDETTNVYCSHPFYRLNFLSDGRAVMCCADIFGQAIVGNVKKQNISEIWNSSAFKKIRELHLKGKKGDIPLCSKCNEWA
jgi:MoaA/NifB/PqqE/SkfB family radical SAM enzyme